MPEVMKKLRRVKLRSNELNPRARKNLEGSITSENQTIPFRIEPEKVTEVHEDVYAMLYHKFGTPARQRLAPDIYENLKSPHSPSEPATMRTEFVERPIIEFLDGPP